jgi:hypothetical protein
MKDRRRRGLSRALRHRIRSEGNELEGIKQLRQQLEAVRDQLASARSKE